jgi:nucleoid DNA-binding protein
MKREEIAKMLAHETGITDSEAKNEVNKLVHEILQELRNGGQVKVPGVGKLVGIPKKAR